MPEYLPNASRARIDPRKLRDYALNPKHETGKYKAAFSFRAKIYHHCPAEGPQGDPRRVTTVWIIRPGNDWPELITVEPATRRKVVDHE